MSTRHCLPMESRWDVKFEHACMHSANRRHDCLLRGLPSKPGQALAAIAFAPEEILHLWYRALSDVGLLELPPAIGALSSLKKLGLMSNALRDLPADFDRLNALEWLWLGNNSLRTVSNNFMHRHDRPH